MSDFSRKLLPTDLEKIMRQSYMDYAMSVIIGRALPDIRDGLKPVHRRALYAMNELKNDWSKPYKKSARVVGDVIGKYHPHGDLAVYEAIVRMAQNFSMRYPLVDGQGNFGSVDGDAPAAMRYTEVRMTRLAGEMLADLDKDTVDFIPNYDGAEQEPVVLPARVPNLLINGSMGIAVAMATSIPPHNIRETLGATIACLDNPEISLDDLISHVQGPDFPTGGLICGREVIRKAYETGSGVITVRARCHFEDAARSGRTRIVVTELPYTVNKARLVEQIAELVRSKKISGISNLRDESDKEGMRVVIEIGQGEIGGVILNRLYQRTRLQISFSMNMIAVAAKRPVMASLKMLIEHFIEHRRDVVVRRTIFELHKARAKAHVLEGQAVALGSIDDVIDLIKASESPSVAKESLMARSWPADVVQEMMHGEDVGETMNPRLARPEGLSDDYGLRDGVYHLSAEQAQAILALRLHRLTSLEKRRVVSDYRALRLEVARLNHILADPDKLTEVIREELKAVRESYTDERRTEITGAVENFSEEDFIAPEKLVITLSATGYAKSQAITNFVAQKRGGTGVTATSVKEGDRVKEVLLADTHDTLLCFSNIGKIYWIKAYRLPRAGRTAKGKPIVNLLRLAAGEKISAILPLRNYLQGRCLVLATAGGIIKKTSLESFSRQRSSGILAIVLNDGDEVVSAINSEEGQHFILASNRGRCIRFNENNLRAMGRATRGVRGIRLRDGARAVSLLCFSPRENENMMVLVTSRGVGKRVRLDKFPVRNRGGMGVLSIKFAGKNESLVGAALLDSDEDLVLVTACGSLIRAPSASISILSRYARGVRLKRVAARDGIVGVFSLPAFNADGQTDDEKST